MRNKTFKFENAVLGMIFNGQMETALNAGLTISHFNDASNQLIFSHCLKCYQDGMPPRPENFAYLLPQPDMLRAVEIDSEHTSGLNVGYFAIELKKSFWLSQVSKATRELLGQIDVWEPTKIIDPISAAIEHLNTLTLDGKKEAHRMDEGAVDEYVEQVMADIETGGVKAISTGIEKIDVTLNGGFMPGKLITFAARPGLGKTALATNMALAAAIAGNRVQYVSIELLRNELIDRFVSIHSEMNTRTIASRKYNESQVERFVDTATILRDIPLTLETATKNSWETVEALIRTEHRLKNTKVVFIDYIQQFKFTTRKFMQRSNEIGEITAAAKALAMDLEITIVLLAQLNRGIEAQAETEPKMSHLKDSGGIEQDSDYIGMLFNANEDFHVGMAIVKNRSGDTGRFKLKADLSRNKFFRGDL